ncbi:MAG: hypothetical protein QF473_33140 [Planctomycetota bacterium]|jgi:hypothetical protein|nr:hypothetical protein [Planctomycetota bacterium]MDP6503388.1 hypothetical protein [Planctomycetota bacterium]
MGIVSSNDINLIYRGGRVVIDLPQPISDITRQGSNEILTDDTFERTSGRAIEILIAEDLC